MFNLLFSWNSYVKVVFKHQQRTKDRMQTKNNYKKHGKNYLLAAFSYLCKLSEIFLVKNMADSQIILIILRKKAKNPRILECNNNNLTLKLCSLI